MKTFIDTFADTFADDDNEFMENVKKLILEALAKNEPAVGFFTCEFERQILQEKKLPFTVTKIDGNCPTKQYTIVYWNGQKLPRTKIMENGTVITIY